MGHYKSNVRDIEFMLFDVLERGKVLGHGPFEDVDADTARELLHQVAELAEGPIGESLLESDRTPPVFDPQTGTVTMPSPSAAASPPSNHQRTRNLPSERSATPAMLPSGAWRPRPAHRQTAFPHPPALPLCSA